MLWSAVGILLVPLLLWAQPNDEEEDWMVFRWRSLVEAPSLGVSGGVAQLQREGIGLRFQGPAVTLRLGSAELRTLRSASLERYEHSYGFLALTPSLHRADTLRMRWWRFGVGRQEGYGYRLGNGGALLLLSGGGLHWSRVTLAEGAQVDALQPFGQQLRFGSVRDGMVLVQLTPLLGIGLAFERAVIFPAHLVWKYLGSSLIEFVGSELIVGEFVRRVLKARMPQAAPVVNFLLRSGVAIGWTELLRTRMNWPFDSPPPALLDQLQLSVQMVF
jgi:hypothetical protein